MRIMRISIFLIIAVLFAFTACAGPATVPQSPNSHAPIQQPTIQPQFNPTQAPTIVPKTTSTPTKTDIVYITRTGEKFHRAGCRYLSKSQIPIERTEAINRGYAPCSVCRP